MSQYLQNCTATVHALIHVLQIQNNQVTRSITALILPATGTVVGIVAVVVGGLAGRRAAIDAVSLSVGLPMPVGLTQRDL